MADRNKSVDRNMSDMASNRRCRKVGSHLACKNLPDIPNTDPVGTVVAKYNLRLMLDKVKQNPVYNFE